MLRLATRVSSPAGKCESLSNASCTEVCKGSGTIIELVPTPPANLCSTRLKSSRTQRNDRSGAPMIRACVQIRKCDYFSFAFDWLGR